MPSWKTRHFIWGLLCCFAVSIFIGISNRVESAQLEQREIATAAFSQWVDQKGNITRPQDYRTQFVHLGSFATATNSGEVIDDFKGVYTRLQDLNALRHNGKFPDGAVLIKDIYGVDSRETTAGRSHYAVGEPGLLFVMIKDTKRRFPDNPIWGGGWGWALFKPDDWDQNVATSFQADCRACHLPVQSTDWIHTFAYPMLNAVNDID